MFIDASKLNIEGDIDADICIVGSGPAAITLANEFLEEKFSVILLESGGIQKDENIQSLYSGPSGEPIHPYHSRIRQLGGTANNWGAEIGENEIGVRYAPLDKIDFEKRDWLPYSGWPFGKNHIDPFYERAHRMCQIGPFNYEGNVWQDFEDGGLEFKDKRIINTVFQFGPRDVFLKQYLTKIKESRNITIYYHANVVEIETNNTASTVTRIRTVTMSGKEFGVRAKLFILATGGIENARLLLLSDQIKKAGLGNSHDLVGRFFMDHFQIVSGVLFPKNKDLFHKGRFYDLHRVNGTAIIGKLSLHPNILLNEGLLNSATYLIPRHKTFHFRRRTLKLIDILSSPAFKQTHPLESLQNIREIINYGSKHAINALRRKLTSSQPYYYARIAAGGWSNLSDKHIQFSNFEIQHLIEQAPNPNNRVKLVEERDWLGCRRIKVERLLMKQDIDSVRRTQQILQVEFERSGFGYFEIENWNLNDSRYPTIGNRGASHHMGTTRMHIDPKQGVVDPNCLVHDMTNLFIAGSSVFPTGGYANPTLTIIALAIRLADYVKTNLSRI
ncbi:MAG: GMC family oxidoreductase [Crocosphaera sp.]|nr:GMC family oxidoreductase [Crocosphaera sp.]